MPVAVVADDASAVRTARSDDLHTIARLTSVQGESVEATGYGWQIDEPDGTVLVSSEFDGGWGAEPGGVEPFPAFGWSLGSPPGTTALRFDDQWIRTMEVAVLAALWLAVLWITRRPVSR
jgi:hypothetical protein